MSVCSYSTVRGRIFSLSMLLANSQLRKTDPNDASCQVDLMIDGVKATWQRRGLSSRPRHGRVEWIHCDRDADALRQ